MNLAFIIGAHGGDYLAVQRAIDASLIDASVVAMVATEAAANGLTRYREIPNADYQVLSFENNKRNEHFVAVSGFLACHSIDLVLLAGFPFILPVDLIDQYPGRIINAHHSLLPAHPGLYRKETRVSSTDRFLGATVHRVNAGVDTGEILYQAVFPNTGMADFDTILWRYRQAQDVMIVQCVRDFSLGRPAGHSASRHCKTLFSPAIDKDILEGMRHD